MQRWKLFFAAPRRCWFCITPVKAHRWSDVWDLICPVCTKALLPIKAPFCQRCGRAFLKQEEARLCIDCIHPIYPALSANRSPVTYTSWAKEIIGLFKYRGREGLADPLGRMMAKVVVEQYPRPSLITFVPLHPARLAERGFNQAELLAQVIAKKLYLPYEEMIVRTKETPPQSKRARHERLLAMKGVFSFAFANSLIGKRVLLVDDVYTTGSTLGECATLLRSAGASQVYAVTFAR